MKRFVWIVVGGVALGAAAAALVQTGVFSGSRTSPNQTETRPDPVEPAVPEQRSDTQTRRTSPTPPPVERPADPVPAPGPSERRQAPSPGAGEGEPAISDADAARLARQRAAARMERQRALAEQREQRDREAQMRRLAQDRAQARQALLERRRQLAESRSQVTRPLGRGATTSQSPTRPDVLEAQRRFRENLTAQTGRRADDDRRGGGVGTTGAAGDQSDGDAPAQDGGVPADLAGEGATDAGQGGAGEGGTSGQQGAGDAGGQPGAPTGGQTGSQTGGGQVGQPLRDGAAGGGLMGAGPVQPSETLSTGNPNLDLNTEIQPVAFWAPAGERTLEDGTRVFANDLYIGFLAPPAGPVFTSNSENGLSIEGASFFQVARTTPNGPLTQAERDALPLAEVDSFLTISEAEPFFTPGGEPDPEQWGPTLMAEWATTDFENAEAIQDEELFGDDRFYVRVARVGAEEGVTMVGGSITATWIDPFSFAQLQRVVQVPHVAEIWPQVETEPEGPGGATLAFESAEVFAGAFVTAALTLDEPAPEGGATWLLTSSDPAVAATPTSVVFEPGDTEITFNVEAGSVTEPVEATVTASSGERSAQATVTVRPQGAGPALDRFTIQPSRTRGGLSAQATIRLSRPAPDGGVDVSLESSDPDAASVPETVTVPRGATSLRATITTFEVPAERTVEIRATLDEQTRAATLIVTSIIFGDVNGDGVLDGLDLADLLNAMGTSDEAADLDGDGTVDNDDLLTLIDLLEQAQEGDGGDGPGSQPPVIARWSAVPINDCDELDGFRSADLFLGFEAAPTVVGVTSPPGTGLRVEGGMFFQHELGLNGPPNPAIIDTFPCVAYDSHVTVGESSPLFTPSFPAPDPSDWGGNLVAEWLQQPGAPIEVVSDPERFGDDRAYVRVARVTAPVGSSFLGGVLEITSVPADGGVPFDADVTVHHCPSCWGEFDLDNDGLVTDGDLEIMISLLDTDDERADLDGDGVVDLDDLRLLLNAIGS